MYQQKVSININKKISIKITHKEWMKMKKKWMRDKKTKQMKQIKIIINNNIILMMKIILRMSLLTLMKMKKMKIKIFNKISLIFNKWIKEYVEISVSIFLFNTIGLKWQKDNNYINFEKSLIVLFLQSKKIEDQMNFSYLKIQKIR